MELKSVDKEIFYRGNGEVFRQISPGDLYEPIFHERSWFNDRYNRPMGVIAFCISSNDWAYAIHMHDGDASSHWACTTGFETQEAAVEAMRKALA